MDARCAKITNFMAPWQCRTRMEFAAEWSFRPVAQQGVAVPASQHTDWWRLFPRCGWAAGVGTVRGGRGLLAARRSAERAGWPGGVGAGSLIGKGNERRVPADQPARPRWAGDTAPRAHTPLAKLAAASRQLDRLVGSRRAGRRARPPWAARCFLPPSLKWAPGWLRAPRAPRVAIVPRSAGSALAQVTSRSRTPK